jgi:pilus assembly protein Flp/PilA
LPDKAAGKSTVSTKPETTMTTFITSFLKRDDGATAIEYGLIAALVSVAIVAALTLLGTDLAALFGTVSGAFPD